MLDHSPMAAVAERWVTRLRVASREFEAHPARHLPDYQRPPRCIDVISGRFASRFFLEPPSGPRRRGPGPWTGRIRDSGPDLSGPDEPWGP
jgi:hypothetical protein